MPSRLPFFVYDSAQNPTWYSVALDWQGSYVWSGTLYAVHGPWFGGPFNTGNVSTRAVGNATFTLNDLSHATLTYTADGVPVIKSITRTTWRNENYTGVYAGGYSIRASGCFPITPNRVQEEVGLISVSQNGTNVSIGLSGTVSGVSCTFSGTYSQAGKLGTIDGSYSCNDGSHGTFSAFEMTPTISGFTARVQGQNQYCSQWTGYLGGIKRAL